MFCFSCILSLSCMSARSRLLIIRRTPADSHIWTVKNSSNHDHGKKTEITINERTGRNNPDIACLKLPCGTIWLQLLTSARNELPIKGWIYKTSWVTFWYHPDDKDRQKLLFRQQIEKKKNLERTRKIRCNIPHDNSVAVLADNAVR